MAGFLTTLVNIYSAQDGDWSIMALLTVILTVLVMVVSATATVYFRYVLLANIEREHEQEIKYASLRRQSELQRGL